MTDEEYKILLDRLMQSIRTNSKTIDQLSEVESVPTDGYLELNRGRKILASRFQKILDTPLTALDYSSMWKSLESSTDEQINTSHLTDALKGLTGNLGTVTMVGVSVPQGLVVANSPVKESGVIAISYADGYSLPTNVKQSNWDTAFSFVDNITKSGTDTVINKWEEIVKFLNGISSSTDLASMLALKMNQSTWEEFKKTTYYHDHPNKALLDSITDTQVYNWNQAVKSSHTHENKAVLDKLTQDVIDNSHTHTNKATLDVIDQSLSTVSAVKFAKVTANDAELGTIKATTADFSGALKAAAATVIGLVTCATLNADAATIPNITATNINASTQVVSPLFVGHLQGNADTATRFKDTFKLWGQDFYGNNVSGAISGATTIDASGKVSVGSFVDNGTAAVAGLLSANGGTNTTILNTSDKATLGSLEVIGIAYIDSSIGTSSYISQSSGWRVTNAGNADFRTIYTDELHATAFTADVSQALAGSDYLTKSVSKLSANFVVPAVGSSVRIIVDDLEGFPATACFENGDYIRFRAFNKTSGLTISDVWGTVTLDTSFGTSGFSNGTQAYIYTVTSAAVTGLTVYKGSEVLDYGKSSDGLIVRTTLDKNNSPYSQIATWVNDPSVSTNYTVHARLGNLGGIANCNGYGLYTDNAYLTNQIVVGDLTKANNYLSYNPSEGLIIKGNLYVSSGAVASTSDVNTAKSSAIDAASSDATNKANSALTSAKSYADSGDSNTLSSAKSYTDTQFSVADGKITAAITTTKTYADNVATTAVNNIQIGGRNLLPKSKYTAPLYNAANNEFSTVNSTGAVSDSITFPITIQYTGQYTVSALIKKGLHSAGMRIVVNDSSFDYLGLGKEYTDYTLLYRTMDLSKGDIFYICIYNHDWGKDIADTYIKNIKLELGNKPTDWSPAPEDIDASIATKVATSTYDAKMTWIDGQISSKVSQTDFNALGQRVSSTESSITQLPSTIDARITTQVQAGGSIYSAVATSLTMTSDGISLFGKNIQLSGAVTFVSSLNQTAQGYANTAQSNAANDATDKANNAVASANGYTNTQISVVNGNITSAIGSVQIGATNLRYNTAFSYSEGFSFTNFGQIETFDILSNYIGKQATISFDIKADSQTDASVYHYQDSGLCIAIGWNGVNVTTDWNRISFTGMVVNNNVPSGYSSGTIGIYNGNYAGKFYIRRVKIESGNKATDWSPAPEDVDSAIATSQTSAQNNLAQKIGYASYDDMVAKATAGNTIINGSYIRTTLIESVAVLTNGLVAHKINADDIDTTSITSSAAFVNSLTANTAFISNLKTNIVNAAYVNTLSLDAAAIKVGTIDTARMNASDIVTKGLQAKTIDAMNAMIQNITVTNATISGTLNGVSGTFTTLTTNGGGIVCKDASGSEIFSLTSSQFYIQAIDMQHQGTYQSRSLRFLSSNIRCRSAFGSLMRNTAKVIGNRIYYYVNGDTNTYVCCTLSSTTYSGVTYYIVPLYPSSSMTLYSSSGASLSDLNGFPVDAVIFNNPSADYRYWLVGTSTEPALKTVKLINASSSGKYAYIATAGAVDFAVKTHSACDLYNMGDSMTPSHTGTSIDSSRWIPCGYYESYGWS